VNLAECTPIRLSSATEIKPFDCAREDLNEFLRDDAKFYYTELIAVTYLFEHHGKTVAFYSVSNDKIFYDSSQFSTKSSWQKFIDILPYGKHRKDFPAVKIGRLGVHKKYQSRGIGTQIIDAIKVSFTTENKTGCRQIAVTLLLIAIRKRFSKQLAYNQANYPHNSNTPPLTIKGTFSFGKGYSVKHL
jgi:GNAT superfamily N-acetyltransferase